MVTLDKRNFYATVPFGELAENIIKTVQESGKSVRDILTLLDEEGFSPFELGRIAHAGNESEKAEKYYQDALTIAYNSDEDKGVLFNNLGILYQKEGKGEEAKEALKGVLALPSTSEGVQARKAKAGFNLGILYQEEERLEEVEKSRTGVLALPSTSEGVQARKAKAGFNLGILYQEEERLDEVEKSRTGVLALPSTSEEVQEAKAMAGYNLGYLYQAEGKLEEAEKALKGVLALPSTSEVVQEAKAKAGYYLGSLKNSNDDFAGAKKERDFLLTLSSDSEVVKIYQSDIKDIYEIREKKGILKKDDGGDQKGMPNVKSVSKDDILATLNPADFNASVTDPALHARIIMTGLDITDLLTRVDSTTLTNWEKGRIAQAGWGGELAKKYYTLARNSSDEEDKAKAGVNLGVLCYAEVNKEQAKEYLEGVIALPSMSEAVQERKIKAYNYLLAFVEEEKEKEKKYLQGVLALSSTSDRVQELQAQAGVRLGVLCYQENKFEEAEKYFVGVLQLPSDSQDVIHEKEKSTMFLQIIKKKLSAEATDQINQTNKERGKK